MPAETSAADFDWSVRRSAKASRIKVTVDGDGVVVTLPESAPESAAAKAVKKLDSWIRDRLADREVHDKRVAERGAAVPWLGELTPPRNAERPQGGGA